MSWSDQKFDLDIPRLVAVLHTNNIQYAKNSNEETIINCIDKHDTCHGSGATCPCPTDTTTVANSCKDAPLLQAIMGCKNDSGTTVRCNEIPEFGTQYCTVYEQHIDQICGIVDGEKTCTLGSEGKGTCLLPCEYNKEWSTDPTNYNAGNVFCQYGYDYTDYNQSGVPNGPLKLAKWVNDIFNGRSISAPSGLDLASKIRLRDACFIFSVLVDFYNQLYGSYYYQNHPEKNNFLQVDFISDNLKDFSQNIVLTMKSFLQPSYTQGISQNLLALFDTLLTMPTPMQNGKEYYLTFQLSFAQFQDYLQQSNEDGLINEYINSLLRDSNGQMINLHSGQQWSPNGAQLVSSQLDFITAIDLSNYSIVSKITRPDFEKTQYFFATAQITAKVEIWSPMLAIYFQVFSPHITYDKETCVKISSQAGAKSSYSSSIPANCLVDSCQESDTECKKNLIGFCSLRYIPPSYTSRTATDDYIVNNNTPSCYCYTSTLSPVSEYKPGNEAAMCFDRNCTQKIRGMFGLADSDCEKHCQKVWQWMHSPDQTNQPQNAKSMDWLRFSQLCGKNYFPYTSAQFNLSIIIVGVTITILTALIVFAVCQRYNYSLGNIISTELVVITIVGGIGAFLARDLAGVSYCDEKNKFVCKSRITKINLPSSFCNYILNCECNFDKDCNSKNCVCVSGTCIPTSGTRPTKTITVTKKDYVMIATSIVILLVFPLLLFLLHKDYHWKITRTNLLVISVTISIIPLIFSLYQSFRPRKISVFVTDCDKLNFKQS